LAAVLDNKSTRDEARVNPDKGRNGWAAVRDYCWPVVEAGKGSKLWEIPGAVSGALVVDSSAHTGIGLPCIYRGATGAHTGFSYFCCQKSSRFATGSLTVDQRLHRSVFRGCQPM
jgi:hypothetical protein